MTKGTIIYIGGFELPDKNAAAHRVINNAKIFEELGYTTVFVTNNREIKDTKKLSHLGFDCWELSIKKSKLATIKLLIDAKKLIEIVNQYDDVKYIIGYNFPAISMLKIKKYCREKKIKLLGDITEWYGTKNKNILYKLVKGIDTTLRMRFVNKRLDGLIVISNYLKNYYNESSVVYLPPLVDLTDEKWKIENRIANEKIQLVYAGSPSREKERLDILIRAVSELSKSYSIELKIVGINFNQYKEIYQQNNFNYYDGKAIKFLGRIRHIDALELVKKADYTIIAREDSRLTKAGFPTKFVESITCGTPVITTDNSDLKYYIDKNKNGFIIGLKDLTKDLEGIIASKAKLSVDKEVFYYKNYKKQTAIFLEQL